MIRCLSLDTERKMYKKEPKVAALENVEMNNLIAAIGKLVKNEKV
jgi:hypothetical protein